MNSLKIAHIILLFFSLLACMSCGKGEAYPIQNQWSVKHVFEPIITEMTSSSPISLPDGVSCRISLINSEQELIDSIPSYIIEKDSLYQNINYDSCCLISIKYRTIYKPEKLEYKIYKEEEEKISIIQRIFTLDSMYVNGFYVMSNIITEKLNVNAKITLWQSFVYQEASLSE